MTEDVRTGKFANEEMRHDDDHQRHRYRFQTALENGDMWFHSDQCYYEFPCRASTLYAIEIPKVGGNTLFANCYAAWETLPQAGKTRWSEKPKLYDMLAIL